MLDAGNYLASAPWGIINEVIFIILIYLNAVEYPYYCFHGHMVSLCQTCGKDKRAAYAA